LQLVAQMDRGQVNLAVPAMFRSPKSAGCCKRNSRERPSPETGPAASPL
jgi:hypothetical protein